MSAFTGLITAEHKTIHKDCITEVLRALSVPCRFIYVESEYTECPNCLLDIQSRRSANIYKSGGPLPFIDGQPCQYCMGVGFIPTEPTEEEVFLGVMWGIGNAKTTTSQAKLSNTSTSIPENYIQTMCSIALKPKILRAKYIIVNTDIEQYKHQKYVRNGEPSPLGFGNDAFILTVWTNG